MKKTNNKFYQRVLALVLALMLCVGMMPTVVLAVDGESQVPTHTHNEGGWTCTQGEATKVLTCEKHVHTDECFKTESVLTCETQEHAHGNECYNADELICETAEHTHDDGCYTTENVKVCAEENHEHTDDCYTVTEGEWTCIAPAAEPSPEPSPAPTCTCDTKCKEGEVNANCPVCSAEGASLDDCAGKYVVYVQTTWPLTGVTIILTGANGEIYTEKRDSLDAVEPVEFKVATAQNYTCKITAVNENGEDCKGECTVYQHMVIGGSIATVSSFVLDVNGMVTISRSFSNPIRAYNGYKYSFQNVTAYLVATDGTRYDMAKDRTGYYSALVPANQTYKLFASGWDYQHINATDLDKSIKHSFASGWSITATDQDSKRSCAVSESRVTTEHFSIPDFDAVIRIDDEGNTEPSYKVTVTTDSGKVIEGETDNDSITLELPGTSNSEPTSIIYTVTVTDLKNDTRSVTKEFSVDALNNGVTVIFPVNHFDVKVNMYADGKLMSTYTKEDVPRNNYFGTVYACSEAVEPARAKFVKVEAFDSEGNPLTATEEHNFANEEDRRLFTGCHAGAKDLEPGGTITFNFYYEYVDQDVEYPVTVTHIFRDASGNPIESATQTYVLPTKAGSRLNVSALRNAGEDWYQPATPVEGYENRPGAWFPVYRKTIGGAPHGLIGQVDDESSDHIDLAMNMIHEDIETEFYYVFDDKYVEYIANNDAAEGGMYTDWSRTGAYKTIKDNRYTYDGYVFTGWNLERDNSGTAYQPGDKVKVDNNITLFAQWRPCNVTVRYVDEDGNELLESVTEQTDAGRYDVRQHWRNTISANGGTYGYVSADRELTGRVFEDTTITLVYSRNPAPTTPPTNPTENPTPTPTPSNSPEPTDDPIEIPDPEPPLTESPDVTPTPSTPPVTPDPEPPVEIPDDDPPLAEIPDEDPPLAEIPDDLTEIEDEVVPLADVPKTGDDAKIWLTLALLSAAGLGVIGLMQRRTRKSGKHS